MEPFSSLEEKLATIAIFLVLDCIGCIYQSMSYDYIIHHMTSMVQSSMQHEAGQASARAGHFLCDYT